MTQEAAAPTLREASGSGLDDEPMMFTSPYYNDAQKLIGRGRLGRRLRRRSAPSSPTHRLSNEDQKPVGRCIASVEAEHQRLALLDSIEGADQDVVKRHADNEPVG